MRAFWLDNEEGISSHTLHENGVDYRTLDVNNYQADLDRIKKENQYISQDIVELSPNTPNLDAILAKFDKEHLHTDDEIRFVLAGEGIFDIRSGNDRWMRVVVSAGDYISVPGHRHHRFFVTDEKSIRCVRLFKDTSGWTPVYRETPTLIPT